ncbi:MAG: Cystathionine beta-lyase, type II (EC [uncultured Sulfurovum sp.]|uniref:cysteine-S-conjugate beta-lyase n=1 Tax=uncultured Sulfurovum sp. TaxID=269237 RepID=A0A6S6SGA0_9BACT|nr:MAG: Cystathionine beta-lyase, type II (EC [uncultured Sulfurovum sp.]
MFTSIHREGTYTTKYDDAKQKFGTDDLMPLWVADMDLPSPLCVQESLAKRAAHPIYGYTVYPPRYYEAIQTWMQKRFSWRIEQEWIVPCYGVVPSLNFAISAYSEVGESIIVQTPLYPPFVSSIETKQRKVLDNTLLYKDGKYSIDFEDFEAKAKEARLFLLCSPHNPTSRAWNEEELEKLIALCLKYDVLIISDEIHADIMYEKIHHSVGSFESMMHKCVVFNAPSKTFNIAGLNTSYAIIPSVELRQKFIQEQNSSGISNGNPFGIEALISAYEEGDVWLDNLKVHLQSNISYVSDFIHKHALPIGIVPTEATFLIWLDCSKMGLTQDELIAFFCYQAKLGLNDGLSFGEAGRGFMRLNIGLGKEHLELGMQRLLQAYILE